MKSTFNSYDHAELVGLRRVYHNMLLAERMNDVVRVPGSLLLRIGELEARRKNEIASVCDQWAQVEGDHSGVQVAPYTKGVFPPFGPGEKNKENLVVETKYIALPHRGSQWRDFVLRYEAEKFLVGCWEKESGVRDE